MDTVHFILYDINCNDYDKHTLLNGVLNTLNPYYDGLEFTLYPKLERSTFNLYYMFVPRKMITSDLFFTSTFTSFSGQGKLASLGTFSPK